jgi:lipoic acid synthetase
VERLQPFVRDRRASYHQSLAVLAEAKRARADARAAWQPPADPGAVAEGQRAALAPAPLYTKTSLMLGLGETPAEVTQALLDLRAAGVDILTLGQYLRPTLHHLAVHEYVTPAAFDAYKQEALKLGFSYVASGPLVRSSYRAGEFFNQHLAANPNSEPAPPPRPRRP